MILLSSFQFHFQPRHEKYCLPLRNVFTITMSAPIPILQIAETPTTPSIDFNAITGELSITGRSIKSDPVVFYQPLFDWIDRYIEEPCHQTTFSLDLEYISSSSLYYISNTFIKLKELTVNGHYVKIIWQYQKDDVEMKEMGEDYADMISMPFVLTAK